LGAGYFHGDHFLAAILHRARARQGARRRRLCRQVEARNLLSMAGQHDHVSSNACRRSTSMRKWPPWFSSGRSTKAKYFERQVGKNCVMGNGYGLGPVGFRARFCPKEPIDLAILAVNTYRKEFAPMVPKFWYGLWQASVDAVWCYAGENLFLCRHRISPEGDFLTMRLPSGRKLYYHRPRKTTTFDPQGNERPSWSFMSYQGKKFRRHLAWHGMITADCDSRLGEARDLIMGAMKRAEAAGLFTIFKVHDELVFEETDRPDITTVVKQIMEDVDPWVIERKFKVKAEVEKMLRYRK
jgi:hypothetical protein